MCILCFVLVQPLFAAAAVPRLYDEDRVLSDRPAVRLSGSRDSRCRWTVDYWDAECRPEAEGFPVPVRRRRREEEERFRAAETPPGTDVRGNDDIIYLLLFFSSFSFNSVLRGAIGPRPTTFALEISNPATYTHTNVTHNQRVWLHDEPRAR